MWRIVCIIALLFLLAPAPALAGSSVNITISAIPGFGVITFSAVYVTDTQVDLAWTKAPAITNVMIRSKYGSAPTSATDGNLVYYGNALAFSDTSMNFDENLGILYYIAYAETAPGVFGTPKTADVEGVVMLMITLFGAAIALMVAGYATKKAVLVMAASIFWAVAGVYAYTLSTGSWDAWDIYLGIAFGCLMLVIVSILSPLALREKKETVEDVLDMRSDAQRAMDDFAEVRNQMTMFRPPPRKRYESDDLF